MRALGRSGSAYGDFRVNAISAIKGRSRPAASRRVNIIGTFLEQQPIEKIFTLLGLQPLAPPRANPRRKALLRLGRSQTPPFARSQSRRRKGLGFPYW